MITTSLFHDTRREKQNNKYPVKLCVNYIHKAKYYATGIDLTKDEFDKLKNKKNAKEIAKKLKFDIPVTTYSARHSFSPVLKRSGASIEFISEALGHTDVKTTESYLDSFENETKK